MSPPIEILVHISGPSRGKDDARYRREAQGFLDFEPVTRQTICPIDCTSHNESSTSQSSGQESTNDEPFLLDLLPSQILLIGQSPEIHRNFDVPNTAQKTPNPLSMEPASFFRETPSTILQRSSIKETPHLLIGQTPYLPRPRTTPECPTPATSIRRVLRRAQSESWQTPPNVIPNSQPTPAVLSFSRPEASSSPYLKRPFDSSSPSPTRASQSPNAKRARLELLSSPMEQPGEDGLLELNEIQQSSTPPAKEKVTGYLRTHRPRAPRLISRPSARPSSAHNASSYPLQIHPERPKTSTSRSTSHLPPLLSMISEMAQLSRLYLPLKITRDIDKLERGHWLLLLGKLNHEVFVRLWDFLIDFVGRGDAGWGTWCIREWVDAETGPVDDGDEMRHEEQHTNGEAGKEEVLKVYCWGEVVAEVWLTLFVGSKRGIKGAGVRWIDASGEAVVVMN